MWSVGCQRLLELQTKNHQGDTDDEGSCQAEKEDHLGLADLEASRRSRQVPAGQKDYSCDVGTVQLT